jgi:hypothetical protein
VARPCMHWRTDNRSPGPSNAGHSRADRSNHACGCNRGRRPPMRRNTMNTARLRMLCLSIAALVTTGCGLLRD